MAGLFFPRSRESSRRWRLSHRPLAGDTFAPTGSRREAGRESGARDPLLSWDSTSKSASVRAPAMGIRARDLAPLGDLGGQVPASVLSRLDTAQNSTTTRSSGAGVVDGSESRAHCLSTDPGRPPSHPWSPRVTVRSGRGDRLPAPGLRLRAQWRPGTRSNCQFPFTCHRASRHRIRRSKTSVVDQDNDTVGSVVVRSPTSHH